MCSDVLILYTVEIIVEEDAEIAFIVPKDNEEE
jgi:hypothetical protein